MSTFEEALGALQDLWVEELEEINERERETEARVEELEATYARLRRDLTDGERELDRLRSEFEALPRLLGLAQLDDDQAEVLALQGKFSGFRERIAAVEERLTSGRQRLAELLGPSGDLEAAVRRIEASFWARGARADLARRVRDEELPVLREALEDRLQAVAPRTWQERLRDEETAARRRKDGAGPLPGLQVVGASAPADGSGLEVKDDGMGGSPSKEPNSGGLVVLDPGPPQQRLAQAQPAQAQTREAAV